MYCMYVWYTGTCRRTVVTSVLFCTYFSLEVLAASGMSCFFSEGYWQVEVVCVWGGGGGA